MPMANSDLNVSEKQCISTESNVQDLNVHMTRDLEAGKSGGVIGDLALCMKTELELYS